MTKRKRLLSGIIGLTMATGIISGAVIANAEEKSSSVLTYTVQPSYVLTIPATIDVEYMEVAHPVGTIAISDLHLAPGKCLNLSLENAEDLALVNEADQHKLKYCLKTPGGLTFTGKRFTENASISDLTVRIYKSEWEKATTGKYSSTATFNVSYENIK